MAGTDTGTAATGSYPLDPATLASDPAGDVPVVTSLAGRMVEFVRLARADRFCVGIQEAGDALRVAQCVTLADPNRLRWGLRSLLCSSLEDWERFDALFDRYWRPANARAVRIKTSGRISAGAWDEMAEQAPAGAAGEERPPRDDRPMRVGASRFDTSSDFRLSELNRDTRPLEQWIETLARRLRKRLLRRRRACAQGRRVHLRRTVRRSLGFGGLPLDLVYQERRRELPRLVLITDVSRSMNVYSYFFLRFARGLIEVFPHADAFVFHTRLTHATDTLRERDSHRLKEKIAWIAAGWGGGTRIGESLQTFNREFAHRRVDSRTWVFILSDGYDTGEPQLLGEQLRRLRQRARRLIWLNPLLGREDFTPTSGGMQAALPHLDLLASAHNLRSLMQIEHMLTGLRP
jgi:uncharacterized protein with von Willebrand factor type A (vWA) domain